jgi:hypothetical protein
MRHQATLCSLAFLATALSLTASSTAPDRQTSRTEDQGEIEVIARLQSIDATPPCGFFHSGADSTYGDVVVLSGSLESEEVVVIHGCPEIPRPEYAEGSGDLKAFRIGDRHRMVLTRRNVYGVDRQLISIDGPPIPRFYCKAVFLASDGDDASGVTDRDPA